MSTFIALDTTGRGCHAALWHQGELLTRSSDLPQAHAREILPMVHDLLAEAGIRGEALDCIAFTQGPGSFTGVRIGVSVVQGMALGWGCPVLGVSSLLALAWMGAQSLPPPAGRPLKVLALLDARMQQVYAGSYGFTAQGWQTLMPEQVCAPQEVSVEGVDLVVGDGALLLDDPLLASLSVQSALSLNAQGLAHMVASGLALGQLKPAHDLAMPVYLRQEVAQLPKKQAGL